MAIVRKIFTAGLLLFVLGCATDHQVLKEYQFVKLHENLIAGLEPDEMSRKILVNETGMGIAPEEGTPAAQKFMAERAAIVDAYRRLSERLGGLVVQANSKADNGQLTNDQVKTIASVYLRGASIDSVIFEAGIARADAKVYISPRKEVYYHYVLGDRTWWWW